MANKNAIQSVEPNVSDLVNNWLKSYKLDYKLEQESLNTEIDQALDDYYSKSGGKGGNRPDAKLLLHANDGRYYPILIEYKGYKDKLVKLDEEGNVANKLQRISPILSTSKRMRLMVRFTIPMQSFTIQVILTLSLLVLPATKPLMVRSNT